MSDPHDLAEREVSVADGCCPLCMADDIVALKANLASLKEELAMAHRVVENHDKQTREAVRIGCENITSRKVVEAKLAKAMATILKLKIMAESRADWEMANVALAAFDQANSCTCYPGSQGDRCVCPNTDQSTGEALLFCRDDSCVDGEVPHRHIPGESDGQQCSARVSGPCEKSKVDPRICRFCFKPSTGEAQP